MSLPASNSRTEKPVEGRHRVRRGTTCPDTGQIQAATPAQFKAKVLIRNLGGDLEPRTRRTR